jgi:hypothetical protein
MPPRSRRGSSSISRRAPTREPRQRILVVCEGEVTERRYFDDLRRHARNPLVEVVIARETGEPLAAVRIAVRQKSEARTAARREGDDNLLFDQVWAVFDVDEHATLAQAMTLAFANGIELAVSNPCFELWALIHFQEQHAHIERHQLRAALQRHMPGYDKVLDFERMHPTYDTAVARGDQLDREADAHGESGRNPTTRVYLLTQIILANR